jgi:hypothetical protein
MRKIVVAAIMVLVVETTQAQIRFEKGWFIDNENKRTVCLIRNSEWKNNPDKIQYKDLSGDEVKTQDISTIQEFGFDGSLRYVRTHVQIDRSAKGSRQRNPEWSAETVFLKVLAEGKATLYQFTDPKVDFFFYRVDSGPVHQLVYKEYVVGRNFISKNEYFRQQLMNEVCHPETPKTSLNHITYSKPALTRYFDLYNSRFGDTTVMKAGKKLSESFHLRLKAGVNLAQFSFHNENINYRAVKTDFGPKYEFKIGLEPEYILPFNKNKWSLFFSPSFQQYVADEEVHYPNGLIQTYHIDYKYLSFPVGIRHYIYTGKSTCFFLNICYIYDLPIKDKIERKPYDGLDLNATPALGLGGGFSWKRLSMEFRYATEQDLLFKYLTISSTYRESTVLLGFRLF